MGKSGGRKKKSGANLNQNQVSVGDNHSTPVVNASANLHSAVLLKRAHELEEESNRRFQAKDYVSALQQYENALKLTPDMHRGRAVFHSNRAACLMQMKLIDYNSEISVCTLTHEEQQHFAIGKYEMAMRDVEAMLIADPNHCEALEIAGRLRMVLGPHQEAQQDIQSSTSQQPLGPTGNDSKDDGKEQSTCPLDSLPPCGQAADSMIQWRQLKLVYDHDIRLAQMLVNCSSKVLREGMAKSCLNDLIRNDPDADKGDSICKLRLHIEEEETTREGEMAKGDKNVSQSSLSDPAVEALDAVIDNTQKEAQQAAMDDWLFEFALLFRTHVGIDPDANIDLHELGVELCSEAREETVTSEEAQSPFDKAVQKFQEVAAVAFFNWGNVKYELAGKEMMATQLQIAYDWVRDKYSLAKKQLQFELAKLHWMYVLTKKEDLSKWDPTETLKGDSSGITDQGEISPEEAAEQAASMQSQIHLFWGNMLFERSQVECKLGLAGDFKCTGASEANILTVLRNHYSNEKVTDGHEKRAEDMDTCLVNKGDN
ncbi:Phosphoprotein phosphatase [Handroanthus impetiginosus]|uniref:Phosphoprotein phosphatase n=1 Tax=Handroanthus impetiginosus TaxID=429701 RepID=A0A2G9GLX1_9LAMI|nr:Phosphoprotein phosphatase [Handroanthus impetiginosus]